MEEIKNILQQKLLPLGSPKLDKAFSLSKNDAVFTEEIKAKIYKPNGSRKPIILYNTSIYQFLIHRDILISKISNVFNYYNNMDEYLLWWRPHPLLLASISSMLPELLNEYEELIARAKSSKSIVYDDSSDLYTALAAADVYYGDANSIAELYKMTGGAVFVTNNANCGIELMAEQLLALKGEDRKSSYTMAGPAIHRDICERLGL